MIIEGVNKKYCRSEDYNYNFDKETGFFARWGKTKEDDPDYSPFGPEILDLEISSGGDCLGNCPFCSPKGTKVETPYGSKNIENIEKDDLVIGYDIKSKKPKINTVKETYKRHFNGELICFELNNGNILKLTPEHPVVLSNGKEILAKEIKNKDIDKIVFFE